MLRSVRQELALSRMAKGREICPDGSIPTVPFQLLQLLAAESFISRGKSREKCESGFRFKVETKTGL